MTAAPIPDALLAEAAGWMARLHDAPDDEANLRALHRWMASSPAHAQAWEKAERVMGTFGQVPPAMRAQALQGLARPDRRRMALRLLGLIAVAPVSYLAWRTQQSDLESGTGQIRRDTLADGTTLTLDTGTRLDIRYTDTLRAVWLRAGRVYAATAPDAGGRERPFIVQTPMGAVQALGTQFTVSLQDDGVGVNVYDGAVRVSPSGGAGSQIVPAGRRVRFNAGGMLSEAGLSESAPAWTSGVLTADDMRLADWAAAMARYRAGVIRCARDVADLRVFGSFSVLDTDTSLALLARTLPVQIVFRTRYWVEIQGRSA